MLTRVPAVFVGRVESIERVIQPPVRLPNIVEIEPLMIPTDDLVAHFVIEKVFKGISSEVTRITVTTDGGPTACGVPFRTGERYLVFAHNESGSWRTSICARTQRLGQTNVDLELLEAMSQGRRDTRINGTITVWGDKGPAESKPGVNIPIEVRGPEGIRMAVSSEQGKFALKDLPDGRYTFQPEVDGGYEVRSKEVEIRWPEMCSASTYILVMPKGAVP